MAFRPARVRVPHLGLLALRAPRTPSAADLLRAGTVRRWLSSEKRELDPNGPSDALTSFTGGLPTQRLGARDMAERGGYIIRSGVWRVFG